MDRYQVDSADIKIVQNITILLKGKRGTKKVTISEGSKISLLVAENMEDVGKSDKVVRGKLISISRLTNYKMPLPRGFNVPHDSKIVFPQTYNNDSDDIGNLVLCIDESKEHDSKIGLYRLPNILDINEIDYIYPEDTPIETDNRTGLTASTTTTDYNEEEVIITKN